ncbi:NAD(P)-binding protein, partial [Bacteroidota bacterium]
MTTTTKYDILQDEEFMQLVKQAYDCLGCGKCSGGCPIMDLFPDDFNPHHLLVELVSDPEKALDSKDIWFCASCYKCNKNCPQAIELPEIFFRLRKFIIENEGIGKLGEAIDTFKDKIPFPESFFRVCFHPERIPLDEEVLGELLAEKITNIKTNNLPETNIKVGIIGSGPAGLHTAYRLRQNKYQVTIFESQDKAGGMLRKCIPEYRIPSESIDNDIERII